jgi:hypothetical protein
MDACPAICRPGNGSVEHGAHIKEHQFQPPLLPSRTTPDFINNTCRDPRKYFDRNPASRWTENLYG